MYLIYREYGHFKKEYLIIQLKQIFDLLLIFFKLCPRAFFAPYLKIHPYLLINSIMNTPSTLISSFPVGQGYPSHNNQGYPPQGYAPQVYAQQGYPRQGYAPQGYPTQGNHQQMYQEHIAVPAASGGLGA